MRVTRNTNISPLVTNLESEEKKRKENKEAFLNKTINLFFKHNSRL